MVTPTAPASSTDTMGQHQTPLELIGPFTKSILGGIATLVLLGIAIFLPLLVDDVLELSPGEEPDIGGCVGVVSFLIMVGTAVFMLFVEDEFSPGSVGLAAFIITEMFTLLPMLVVGIGISIARRYQTKKAVRNGEYAAVDTENHELEEGVHEAESLELHQLHAEDGCEAVGAADAQNPNGDK